MLIFPGKPNKIVMQCAAGAATLDSKPYENHNLLSLESSPVLIGTKALATNIGL